MRKTMRKTINTILICALLSLSTASLASSFYRAEAVGRIFVTESGQVRFGVKPPTTANTCDYYDTQFVFDATTEAGKNMLSLLLSAKVSQAKIDVWYRPASNPGTDESNGCRPSNMATASNVGLI